MEWDKLKFALFYYIFLVATNIWLLQQALILPILAHLLQYLIYSDFLV